MGSSTTPVLVDQTQVHQELWERRPVNLAHLKAEHQLPSRIRDFHEEILNMYYIYFLYIYIKIPKNWNGLWTSMCAQAQADVATGRGIFTIE